MGTGIIVCGLNGAGKSTLGKALAKELGYYFIDNENLYFPKNDSDYPYAVQRDRNEVSELLLKEIKAHENFVFTSVKGDYGEEICSFFRYAVLIDVPKEIRMQRVKRRSFEKFGNRMLYGGDLYESEKRFFDFVETREEDTVEKWLKTQNYGVIRIDGTKSIEENVDFIMTEIKN